MSSSKAQSEFDAFCSDSSGYGFALHEAILTTDEVLAAGTRDIGAAGGRTAESGCLAGLAQYVRLTSSTPVSAWAVA